VATAAHAQQQTLTEGDGAAGDFFGMPIAISGRTLVVGATGDDGAAANQGSVRVFIRTGGVWTEQQTLTASDGAPNDGFGGAVAINGNTLIVGASSANVKEVAASGATTTRANAGAVYVFVERGGLWTQEQKLLASDRVANDLFGTSVSFQGDTLIVGAMGVDGNRGAAYVFTRNGAVWTEQQKLAASDRTVPSFPFDTFGRFLVLGGDTLVIGTPRNGIGGPTPPGAAYVFVRSNDIWAERQKLTAGDDGQTNRFGNAIVLVGDTLVVASPGANNDRGAAYVFVRDTFGVWNQRQKVTASDGLAGDNFGSSLALRGGALLVGAAGDDVGASNNQGSAYVFGLADGAWIEQQKLTTSDGATGDGLGFSVAINGNQLLVGTHLDQVAGNMFQGSVRVFSSSPSP
jgi:hypothetical protein